MQHRPAASLFIYRPAGCNPGDESLAFPASAERLAKSSPLNGTTPFHHNRVSSVHSGGCVVPVVETFVSPNLLVQ